MPPTLRSSLGFRLVAHLVSAIVAVVCLVGVSAVQAQTVTCGVGQEVEGELGGGKGTIAEVGEAPPHVGWYRIVFTWNPKGDWYDPKSWKLYAVGSTNRCQAPDPAGPPKPAASTAGAAATPVKAGASAPAAGTPSKTPTAAPAAATPALPSTQNCRTGTRVTDRQNRSGSITGERNGMCVVRLDDGETRSYLAWMLTKEGAAGPGPEDLAPGSYSCSAGSAGSFPIVIHEGGTYADRAGQTGRFSFDSASAVITFSSGSLAGQYSKRLGPGKFGLSSVAAKNFSVVCNLR